MLLRSSARWFRSSVGKARIGEKAGCGRSASTWSLLRVRAVVSFETMPPKSAGAVRVALLRIWSVEAATSSSEYRLRISNHLAASAFEIVG